MPVQQSNGEEVLGGQVNFHVQAGLLALPENEPVVGPGAQLEFDDFLSVADQMRKLIRGEHLSKGGKW